MSINNRIASIIFTFSLNRSVYHGNIETDFTKKLRKTQRTQTHSVEICKFLFHDILQKFRQINFFTVNQFDGKFLLLGKISEISTLHCVKLSLHLLSEICVNLTIFYSWKECVLLLCALFWWNFSSKLFSLHYSTFWRIF